MIDRNPSGPDSRKVADRNDLPFVEPWAQTDHT